jgi:hypothetical protein
MCVSLSNAFSMSFSVTQTNSVATDDKTQI